IEDPSVIREILKHLGLWLTKARPPPKIHVPWGHDAGREPAERCPPEQHDDGRELVEQCPQKWAAHDLQPQTHADTIEACPRPERGATPNTLEIPIFTHNITPHQKRRAVEICLDCTQKRHLTG
ncbi:MAG: hypothetical protein WCK00_18245, partial [Deltaproteobacteria bacterium]